MKMKYINRLCCLVDPACHCNVCKCKFCDQHAHEFCNCRDMNEGLIRDYDLLIDKPSWAKEYENEKKEKYREQDNKVNYAA